MTLRKALSLGVPMTKSRIGDSTVTESLQQPKLKGRVDVPNPVAAEDSLVAARKFSA